MLLAMALLLYLRANEPNVPERTIIAHAGGNIDSLEYTNSREAVEHAIAGGVKFIELDIVISPEGEPLRGKNGKTYTPRTWREINEMFLEHPDVTFVVDKTDDPVVLEKFFPKLKYRMVVECFSMDRYREVKHAGFKEAMLNEDAVSPGAVIMQDIKHLFNSDEPRVNMIAIGRKTYINDRPMRRFIKLCNIPMAMWSATDRKRADEMFDDMSTLRMVYTNDL